MIKKVLAYIFICVLPLSVLAQDGPPKKFNLGIKTAVNFSTLLGDELNNPRPRFGYSAGFYYSKPVKKKYLFQGEFQGTFRGSNFNHPVGQYQSIPIFSLDVPLLFGFPIAKKKHLLVGPQVGYVALSSMYTNKAQGKAHVNDVSFQPMLFDAVLAYQSRGEFVGFQSALKYSIVNMNNGVFFEGVEPATGNNGMIRSLSLELAMIF